jgi:peroxiredoxin Q/BCP
LRGATPVHAFRQLRIAATTVAATTAGLFRMATGRGERRPLVLAPGDVAPDFELEGSDGRTYRLADSRGREAVVVAWFPKAFTGGCTIECESLGRSTPAFRQFHAKVFGASLDRPATNRRFAESMGIDVPILSDTTGAVARAYGVIGASGFAHRWTFYIGVDGRILDIDKGVDVASHGDTVARRLEELQIPRLASGAADHKLAGNGQAGVQP